jgi:hypothetical protein
MLIVLASATAEILLSLLAMEALLPFEIGAKAVIATFFLRHFLAWMSAAFCARSTDGMGVKFSVLVVGLALISFHALYIWKANGMLELWPPILALDIVAFLPTLPIWNSMRAKRKRT